MAWTGLSAATSDSSVVGGHVSDSSIVAGQGYWHPLRSISTGDGTGPAFVHIVWNDGPVICTDVNPAQVIDGGSGLGRVS